MTSYGDHYIKRLEKAGLRHMVIFTPSGTGSVYGSRELWKMESEMMTANWTSGLSTYRTASNCRRYSAACWSFYAVKSGNVTESHYG